MTEVTLLSAFLLGLMGAGHCLGMCGGIIGSLSMATNHSAWGNIFYYQVGRIASYSLIGLAAGLIGAGVATASHYPFFRLFPLCYSS